ncbi:Acetyltransferase (GNAT) family protein [compost metagenome]
MEYEGAIEVLLSSETQGIDQLILDAVLDLAESEACSLAAYSVSVESPLALLPKVQVRKRLIDNLQPFFGSIKYNRTELTVKSGLILAFDDGEPGARTVVGFIDFIPRLYTQSTASIGVIVVSPEHRGKGVMKAMLAELQKRFPVLVLDCSLKLVHMYEGLGFYSIAPEGAHVSMANGLAEGKAWEPEQTQEHKLLMEEARNRIRKNIGGDEYDKAMADLRVKEGEQKRQVNAYFASCRHFRA